jgi:hypothetical protein
MKEEFLVTFAEKIGTTVDKLWSALLKQAPISGTIDIVIYLAMIFVSIIAFKVISKKTTVQEGEKYADWEGEKIGIAWAVYIFVVGIISIAFLCNVGNTISAFFNPEYWALMQIVGSK